MRTYVRKSTKQSDGSYYIQRWNSYGEYLDFHIFKAILFFPFKALLFLIQLPFKFFVWLHKKLTFGKTGFKRFLFSVLAVLISLLILLIIIAFFEASPDVAQ